MQDFFIRLLLVCLISGSSGEEILSGNSRLAISSKAEGSKLQRLTIVSEVPTSRKRTTYQTRRILKPDEDVSNSRRTSSALEESSRPRAGIDEFRVLKEAEEGV